MSKPQFLKDSTGTEADQSDEDQRGLRHHTFFVVFVFHPDVKPCETEKLTEKSSAGTYKLCKLITFHPDGWRRNMVASSCPITEVLTCLVRLMSGRRRRSRKSDELMLFSRFQMNQ